MTAESVPAPGGLCRAKALVGYRGHVRVQDCRET